MFPAVIPSNSRPELPARIAPLPQAAIDGHCRLWNRPAHAPARNQLVTQRCIVNYTRQLTVPAMYPATPSPNIPCSDSDGTDSGTVKMASDLQNLRSSHAVSPLLNAGTDARQPMNRLACESTENQSDGRVEYNM